MRNTSYDSDGVVILREPKPDNDLILSYSKVPYHAVLDSKPYLKTFYILYDDNVGQGTILHT